MEAAAAKAKKAGNRHFHAGAYEEAKAQYSRGIELADAGSPQVLAQLYLNRSATDLKLEQLDAAEQDAHKAAVLLPQWGKPHVRLAEVFQARREYLKATDELEIAIGLASAAQDGALVAELGNKLDEARLLKSRGESQSQTSRPGFERAYRETIQACAGLREDQDPRELLDRIVKMKLRDAPGPVCHVMLGHQALRDGRYDDAAREFLTAATDGNAEGMYNYAMLLEAGKGVEKSISEAVQWLERAAEVPIQDDGPANRNAGIGEATSALAHHYHLGIHFPIDEMKAVELWRRAAELGSPAALNALGVLHMKPSSSCLKHDLALARDYLRQAAENFSEEAMLNLADLHASLHDYEVAVRWAETAHRFGFLAAADAVKKYRELAAMSPNLNTVDPVVRECFVETNLMARMGPRTVMRDREPPSLEELRVVQTPYVQRLCHAKELMNFADAHAVEDDFAVAAAAVQAHRIPDSSLMWTPYDKMVSHAAARAMLDMDIPLDAGLAILLQEPEPAALVSYYTSLHRQFPEDYTLAIRAACVHMFDYLPSSSKQQAMELFDAASELLPRPDDDNDPLTLDYLSVAGPAYVHTGNLSKAKTVLARFVAAGARDGHRKTAEAHFHLGVIALVTAQKKGEARRRESLRIAVSHLEAGREFAMALPVFLQPVEPLPNERGLENMVRMLAMALQVPVDIVSPNRRTSAREEEGTALRGGEVLDGPRRHVRLRRSRSRIIDTMKKKRLPIAKMMARSGRLFKWTTPLPPTRKNHSRRGHGASVGLSPVGIDELFSALRDKVYEGRSLECVVVTPACSTGSSYSVLVEDSLREPALVAVYNAHSSLTEQLVPGRVLVITDPYVRIAADQSILVRVDSPNSTLRVGAIVDMCWNCSSAARRTVNLRTCAKCHHAKYCSRECQTEDWKQFGHRYWCA